MNIESAKIAGLLRARGIGPGDRVGLQIGDPTRFAATFDGILQVGAVVVIIDPLLGDAGTERRMAETGAVLIFDEPSARLPGHTPDFAVTPRNGDDLAVIDGDVRLTYDDLMRKRAGLTKHDNAP